MAVKAATGVEAPPARLHTRLIDGLTLKAHALAVRFDLAPAEFGDADPVDDTDPAALRREWLRQLRMWASYNPEDVFALKAAALVGVLALGGLLALVAVV